MTYTIKRGNLTYGPYSPQDVDQYLKQGMIAVTDLACRDGNQNWVPLGNLLQQQQAPPRPPTPGGSGSYPTPPSLHWFIVLLLSGVSSGLFLYVWLFVQSAFIKKIDRSSKATLYFALSGVCALVCAIAFGILSSAAEEANNGLKPEEMGPFGVAVGLFGGVGWLCLIATIVLFQVGIFAVRNSLQIHYRDVEPMSFAYSGQPVGLRLSGALTFFFSVYYLQYHLSRIAKWKETGVLT